MVALASLVLGASLNPGGLIAWIIIGLIAGFLAGKVMRGAGYGVVVDVIVGLVGALIGGFLVNLLVPDANFGLIGSIIVAFIGACLLVWIIRMFSGNRTRV